MSHVFRSRVVIGSAAVFVAAFGVGAVALAQTDIGDEKLDAIRQRCSSSQLALQQIEKRDAVSRINRGRDYDQMLRQISALNSRFAYNKISSPDLLQLTTNLQTAIDKFRSSYDRYDTDISDAMKVNCKDKPADYYNLIIKARGDRNIVGDEVKATSDLMAQYRSALLIYKDTAK